MKTEKVRITAADYRPLAKEPWDGCPFSDVPEWLEKALDDGLIVPHTRHCTDYAEWDVQTREGVISMSPGDYIKQEDLAGLSEERK